LRSEPLKVNKKGKVINLLASQIAAKYPWRLVVTDIDGHNRGKKFKSYKKAKKAQKRLQQQHPDLEYTIVSLCVGYGPPRSKITDEDLQEMNSRGRYWCPYCRKFRIFDLDPYWNWNRCPVCRMPDHNWHVMRNNPRLVSNMYGELGG
jgi:hypothetical protein